MAGFCFFFLFVLSLPWSCCGRDALRQSEAVQLGEGAAPPAPSHKYHCLLNSFHILPFWFCLLLLLLLQLMMMMMMRMMMTMMMMMMMVLMMTIKNDNNCSQVALFYSCLCSCSFLSFCHCSCCFSVPY